MITSRNNQEINFHEGELNILEFTAEKFSLYDYHFRSRHNIILSYKGPVDKDVLSVMGSYIREILKHYERASKKLFKIFVELAQNIAYYSEEKNKYGSLLGESGVGTIVIIETPTSFQLFTGNMVRTEDVPELRKRCEYINKLDIEGLRSYKREQLDLPDSETGGANIGLIQVAITSENPLEFEISEIDKNISFFALLVKVFK